MSYLRTQITGRIKTMLGQISVAGGYRTDIGSTVNVGLLRGNPDEVPSIFVIPGSESGAEKYGESLTEAKYSIVGAINRNETTVDYTESSAEWAIIDAMIADIRQIMEGRDATLEGLTQGISYQGATPQYHEEAKEIVSAEVNYLVRFSIARGDPESAPS